MDFRNYFRSIDEGLETAMRVLERVLGIAGRAGVLAGAALVVYAVGQLFFGVEEPGQSRTGRVLALLNANWKAVLLVALPLLYLPLKTFLGSVTEITFGGTKFRRGKYPPDELDDEESHPRG